MRSTNFQEDIFRQDVYFMFWFLKNAIENQIFHFLTKICEIQNKRLNEKLFA